MIETIVVCVAVLLLSVVVRDVLLRYWEAQKVDTVKDLADAVKVHDKQIHDLLLVAENATRFRR